MSQPITIARSAQKIEFFVVTGSKIWCPSMIRSLLLDVLVTREILFEQALHHRQQHYPAYASPNLRQYAIGDPREYTTAYQKGHS